jgi:hypothetical protein
MMPSTGAATGVSITQVAIYQGPKRVLMGGMQTGNVTVPVVAGRDALVRVFVQTDGSYDGSPVIAHLFLGQGSAPLEVVGAVGASSEGDLGSTINFDVPGASIVPGVTYRVELTQTTSKGDNPAASTPQGGGFDSLGSVSDGASLKVVVVPVQYGADGSNRVPDTSAAQLATYKAAFMATYPIDSMDISVGAPFYWGSPIDAAGNGWNDLLTAMADYRQQQGAPSDTYYFGAFNPADDFGGFCGGGCVAGLGWVGGDTDTWSRAAIGLGYGGSLTADTAIHEIGHNHGRNHAPCGGAGGVDPGFPYANADIGDWFYNIVTRDLVAPGTATDMMGYCDPKWISDYTFDALFTRIKLVNHAEVVYAPGSLDRLWERARIDAQGNLSWLSPIQLHLPPGGAPISVNVQTAGGVAAASGHVFSFDHLPGGVLFWPAGASPTTGVQVSLAGQVKTLVH